MWIVRLTDPQRDALRALIEAQGTLGPSLSGALDGLGLARWDDLPEAELPWVRVGELAEAQGISEADVVWDLAAGMPGSEVTSGPRRPARRLKRAPRASGGTG